jgi:uncharacterized phage protein (TIGR01671 family)
MRELKYRLLYDNKFIYRDIHDRNWYTESKGGKLVKGTHPSDAYLPCDQYTGLTDKNGVEIYDNDIVKVQTKHGFNSELLNEFKEINNLDSLNGIGTHFIGVIKIDLLRGLMFLNPTNGYSEPMFTRHIDIKKNHSGLEIIGNLHQNSDLLK